MGFGEIPDLVHINVNTSLTVNRFLVWSELRELRTVSEQLEASVSLPSARLEIARERGLLYCVDHVEHTEA